MAKNFGFNIGGGGIADLVATPKITPIRSGQFAPTPQLRKDIKDPKKGITGALLGAVSPLLGEAAVKGLGKLPGLENLLYQKDSEALKNLGITPSPTAVSSPTSPIRRRSLENITGRKLTEDQYEALESNEVLDRLGIGKLEAAPIDPFEIERQKRAALINQALPQGSLPKQKTLLGKALTEGLSYAPATLLDEDSAAEYLKTVGATRKAQRAVDTALVEDYLKRSTERGKKLADTKDFTRGIGNGIVLRDNNNRHETVRREFLVSPDKRTRYILSKGDNDVDYIDGPLGSVPVPKGQYYIREDFVLDPKDLPKDEAIKLLVTTSATPKKSTGVVKYGLTKEGLVDPTIYVRDYLDDGKLKTLSEMNALYDDIWHTPQPGFAYEAQPFRAKPLQSQIDWMEKRELKQGALQASLRPLETLGELALEAVGQGNTAEERSELFADTGALAGVIVDLRRNIDAFGRVLSDSIGMSPISALKTSLNKGQDESYALDFFDKQQLFASALDSGDQTAIDSARRDFRIAARKFRDNIGAQGGTTAFLDVFTTGDNAKFDEIAVKRSRIVSAQLRLAYMSAAQDGSTGVALSDKDVANYLTRVGFGSNNPVEVLDKVSTIFEEQVGDFDSDSTPRGLFVNSRGTSAESIRKMDEHVRGYGVSQEQINAARDMSKSEEERIRIANQILDTMNQRTQNLASSHFNYDPKTGRIVLNDVQKILENQLTPSYSFFVEKILPRRGISMETILQLRQRNLEDAGISGQAEVNDVYGQQKPRKAF